MTDKTEEAIRRAKRAELLLQDDILLAAFDALRKDAIEAMVACFQDDLADRRAEVLAIDKLKRKLQAYVTDGKIAVIGNLTRYSLKRSG